MEIILITVGLGILFLAIYLIPGYFISKFLKAKGIKRREEFTNEKIRKEKEKEKQKAEDKRIKEEQEQKLILDEERKAKKIAEEKRRKEEEKQNNGYYIEIDTNGKTEITGPFEEKKIKDLFDAGKLNLTSKIKKGVKTKSFSSLSTLKTFTKGLDDWL